RRERPDRRAVRVRRRDHADRRGGHRGDGAPGGPSQRRAGRVQVPWRSEVLARPRGTQSMAKKKKRRPTPTGRSGGVATTTTGRGRTPVPTIKPEPSSPGGPN